MKELSGEKMKCFSQAHFRNVQAYMHFSQNSAKWELMGTMAQVCPKHGRFCGPSSGSACPRLCYVPTHVPVPLGRG